MIPRIQNDNGIPTLYVHDKPFFARSGEIHNSSSSNLDYMKEHVWPALRELNKSGKGFVDFIFYPIREDQDCIIFEGGSFGRRSS